MAARLAVTLLFSLICVIGAATPARAQLGALTQQFIGIGCDIIPDQLRTGIAALSIYPRSKLDRVVIDSELDLLVRNCAEKLADSSCSSQVVDAMISIAGLAPAGSSTVPFLDLDEMTTVAGMCGAAGALGWATGIGGGFLDTAKKCAAAYAAYKVVSGVYQARSCTSRSESVHDIASRIALPMAMSSMPGENFEIAVQHAINAASNQGRISAEEARAVRAEIATRRRIITGQ